MRLVFHCAAQAAVVLLIVFSTTIVRAAEPLAARIGVIYPGDTTSHSIAALRDGLRDQGYIEGRNLVLQVVASNGDNARLTALAAEIVASKPNIIVTDGVPAIRAANEAAGGSIPIVMAIVGDPVAAGFAQSLAHPGGNLTGFSSLSTGLLGKRLELLTETVPNSGCVGVLHNPDNRALDHVYMGEITEAAQRLGVPLHPVALRQAAQLEAAFMEISANGCRALVAFPDPVYTSLRGMIAAAAIRNRLPTIYDNPVIVEAGGLMAYGPDLVDYYRHAALYVDKILKGARPGDLPIEQPTKFKLVINTKTAKALDLAIPQSILVRADEVIE